MELEIIAKKANPLLQRQLVHMRVQYDAETPSRSQIKASVAKKLGAKEDCISINEIKPHFGKKAAEVYALVYDKSEVMASLEQEHIASRIKTEKPKEEAAAAEPAKEA